MKRAILIHGLLFIANMLFAQNWLLGGDLLFTLDRTNPDSTESPDFTRFTSELYFGRYIFKNFAIGGEIGYYCVNFTKTSFKFGPFIEYEFLKWPHLSLSIKSSLDYRIYSNSIIDKYSGRSIDFDAFLLLNFPINENLEVFISPVDANFQHLWWDDTVLGIKTNYSRNFFNIALNDLKIGVKFKL